MFGQISQFSIYQNLCKKIFLIAFFHSNLQQARVLLHLFVYRLNMNMYQGVKLYSKPCTDRYVGLLYRTVHICKCNITTTMDTHAREETPENIYVRRTCISLLSESLARPLSSHARYRETLLVKNIMGKSSNQSRYNKLGCQLKMPSQQHTS